MPDNVVKFSEVYRARQPREPVRREEPATVILLPIIRVDREPAGKRRPSRVR